MRLRARSSVRYLLQHRGQLLLSVVGVALGVAVVLSIDLAIQSARAGFRISAETVSGRATHQVSGQTGSIKETLLTRLRTELGVRDAAPVVEGFARSPRLGGRSLRILGIDPFSEGPFRPFVAGGASGIDVSTFVTTPTGVVLSALLANSAGVEPGDTLPVVVGGQAWDLPVVGTLEAADRLTSVGLSDVLVMDIAGAQHVLGMRGELTRIDLRLVDSGASADELARIEAALGPGASLEPVGTRTETMSGMIAAFDVNLTALSLLALIFGTFLIYNAMTFSVVQRRVLLGRLRAIGVTKREVLAQVLGEAAAIGAAGAVVGVALGVLLARSLVRLVTRTINDLYFSVSVEGVAVEPLLVVKALALGLGATLLAALPPALEAAASEPRLALLRSISESKARRAVPRAAALGGMVGVVGVLLLVVSSRSLIVSFIALFFVIAGMALAVPAGTVLVVALLRPVVGRVAGTLGAMASRGVATTLSRTSPAIAALVVAVSVTVGLGVMIQSFRTTLARWLDGTLQADIYVSLPGPRASQASGTLWPELVDAYIAHSEVTGHSTYRAVDVVDERGGFRLVALDLDPRGEAAFDFVDGDHESVMDAFQAGAGALVSEPYAFHRGLAVGDSVELRAPAGSTELEILGVYYDYGSDRGAMIVPRRLYDRLYDDAGITSLGLFLAPGADSRRVAADLLTLVPQGRTVVARTNDTLRDASLEVFDRTFEVTAVLRLLAFIVAFVGVVSALMALELERVRELGVLRAVGLTPAQVSGLVVAQTGLMGLVAGLLALPMGIVLSIVMIYVVNKRSFGWTLDMAIGPEVLAQAVGLALVGALLAGVYPAWRMSRTSPAEALRGE